MKTGQLVHCAFFVFCIGMNEWIENAHQLLKQSLTPIPKELNDLDWKSGLSANTEKLAKHISAFTNYPDGGYLVYGLNNDGQPHHLSQAEIEQITQKLGNIARNSLSHSIAIEHAVENYKGEPVLFIRIPEHHEKPVYLKGRDIFESYTRSAGQTVKLSQLEVKKLISISSGYTFESQIALHNITATDIILQYLDVDSYFSLQEQKLPSKIAGIIDILATDDLVRRSNNNWDILNLGAILFAKNIDKFKLLQRKAIRVIVYKETNRVNAIKEQVGAKGYAAAFKGLIHYIMEQLPANEVIENAIRTKVKVYPEIAIREFVANALIHQDFAISGAGVMIEIFIDRIEITNPGVPLVDTNRFIDTAPKSRNETLAGIMRRLNICEERGSGIDRALTAIETFQLPAPKFIKGDDYTRVIIYAPMVLTKMDIEDRTRACYQHCVLNYLSNQSVNNQSVRKRFSIPKNNVSFASKIISDTVDSGFIKPKKPDSKSRKFISYVPYWA